MTLCKFCCKEILNKGSLISHEKRCKLNPSKVIYNIDYSKRKTSNQYIKAKEYNLPVPKSHRFTGTRGIKKGCVHSEEFKKRQRDNAIKRRLGGNAPSRHIKYKDKTLHSSYELIVAKSLDEHKIKWDTCKRFKYIDPNGKQRTYTPDFYLLDFNVYLDPKNDFLLNNDNPRLGFSDQEKIQLVCKQNNIKVIILDKNNLNWNKIKMLI